MSARMTSGPTGTSKARSTCRWVRSRPWSARARLADTDTPVVVVCAVGARSARVAGWLNAQGYQAINLDGGINAWLQAGRPIVR